jgi:hypothetical protein
MRLVIALVVWAAALGGAFALQKTVASHYKNSATTTSAGGFQTNGSSGNSGNSGNSGGASFDASKVKAADADSLFHTANFQKALGTIQAHVPAGAKIDMVVIYPGYLDVTAVKNGTETDLYVNAQGSGNATTGGSPGSDTLFSLKQVKVGTPAALAHVIATAGHTPLSQLNYMVARSDPVTNKFEWLVYPLSGNRVEYYEANGNAGQLQEYLANSQTGLQPVKG